jgi:hypothetical protein
MTDTITWTHQYAWLPDFYANDRAAFDRVPETFRDEVFNAPLTQETVRFLEGIQEDMNNACKLDPVWFNTFRPYVTLMRESSRLLEYIHSTRPLG